MATATTFSYQRLFDGTNSPQNIAIHAFLLGLVGGMGIMATTTALIMEYHYFQPKIFLSRFSILLNPQLGIYIAALAWFHVSEYLVTAIYNSRKLQIDSFLINNGMAYHVAHLSALIEFVLFGALFRNWKIQFTYISFIGLILVIVGQVIRTLAQVHARQSFSHQIARGSEPANDHKLVTSGIYGFSRHPSYLGFFVWAVGTQIMLRNPISTCSFSIVLWRFFRNRIEDEELELVKFFGQDYVDYRNRVGTMIPFIR